MAQDLLRAIAEGTGSNRELKFGWEAFFDDWDRWMLKLTLEAEGLIYTEVCQEDRDFRFVLTSRGRRVLRHIPRDWRAGLG